MMPTTFKTAKEAEAAAKLAIQSTSAGFYPVDITTEPEGDGFVAVISVDQETVDEADRNAVIDHKIVTTACPPAVAKGSDTNAITREQVYRQRREWMAKHGLIDEEEARKGDPIAVGKLPAETRYTYLGEGNHRIKKGGGGWLMIEWLKKNPGANRKQMAAAGHTANHIRWDMERFPHLFSLELPGQDGAPAEPVNVEDMSVGPKAVREMEAEAKAIGAATRASGEVPTDENGAVPATTPEGLARRKARKAQTLAERQAEMGAKMRAAKEADGSDPSAQ